MFPEAFLLHRLHTFLLDKVRNGSFSNTDSLTLAQNLGLKIGNFRINQVKVQLLQLESSSQANSRDLNDNFLLMWGILNIIARF